MKNKEIIANAAVKARMMSAAEARSMVENGRDIPLHTLQGWNLRGNYRIKDGEEPIEVKLWKKKENGGFYLAKAYLYRGDQMELEN